MKQQFSVIGMTCQGCVASVTQKLQDIPAVEVATVSLEKNNAVLELNKEVSLLQVQQALPNKYVVSAIDASPKPTDNTIKSPSKWKQLQPLFLIFSYLIVATILLHYKNWSTQEAMSDFMGLFYIVFSFFKFLDVKGFASSFTMYDPLARLVPSYGTCISIYRIGIRVAIFITAANYGGVGIDFNYSRDNNGRGGKNLGGQKSHSMRLFGYRFEFTNDRGYLY